MVVEFAFFLVGQELGSALGVHLRLFVHDHGHAFVSVVARMTGVVLC
jgi:hypothetical protein